MMEARNRQDFIRKMENTIMSMKWRTCVRSVGNCKWKDLLYQSDGYALMGMKKVDGKCYWFHTKSGYMFKNRRVTRSTGDIYYFGSDGVRCENGMYKIREKKWGNTPIISRKTEKRIRDG